MAFASPEDKFGIKIQNKPGPGTVDQKHSVLMGLVVLLLGILGFFLTGFDNFTEMTNHSIFGLFQTNGFHDLVYVIFGLFWLLGAFALTPAGNQGVNIAAGGALLLVALATLIVGSGLLSGGGR